MSKPKFNAKDFPGKDFKSRMLDLVPFTGSQIFLAFQAYHPDPSGFVPGKSRFSDPRIQPDPTHNPKFSSWGKELLCQVVDVDPKTVFGNFDNG